MFLLVPIFGMLGSVMIFNEHLSLLKWVVMVLIVAGLATGLYGQRVINALLARGPEARI